MTDRTLDLEARPTPRERALQPDERSMRLMELVLAACALAAAILLGIR
jgi:hypothetical protein